MKRVVVTRVGNPVIRRTTVHYGECQKNHAASMGGYSVDGCREFLASSGEGTDGAFTCAACGCHRSFHKRQERVVTESLKIHENGACRKIAKLTVKHRNTTQITEKPEEGVGGGRKTEENAGGEDGKERSSGEGEAILTSFVYVRRVVAWMVEDGEAVTTSDGVVVVVCEGVDGGGLFSLNVDPSLSL
ncbi:hypothetical protein K1719_031602 [Acacia pycnantha]|nr:hypothetical protein K1719_031602 [Acacia pycnantha]